MTSRRDRDRFRGATLGPIVQQAGFREPAVRRLTPVERWWVGAALVVGIVLVVLVVVRHDGKEYRTVMRSWDPQTAAVSTDGHDVVVSYLGGVCERNPRVATDAGDDRVVLTITVAEETGTCISLGVQRQLTAHLDSPLGGRELADGAR